MKWLEKLGLSRRTPKVVVHPPWRAGQYVTYVLDRDDGSWVAFALRVVGQAKDGAWVIEGDFKTASGECAAVFRSDPGAPADAVDPVPIGQRVTRRSRAAAEDPEDVVDDPTMAGSLAMNLLLVRRAPAAAASLAEAARAVEYPCGIDRAHLLVTPGPGYQKHHDLCPRVMVTGVARLAVDGDKHPMTVTSFGVRDADADAPSAYDDFVDLSHPQHVDHEGFALTYPATWFFRSAPDEEVDGLRTSRHGVNVGGVSCALACSVTIYSGDRGRVEAEHDAARARLSGQVPNMSPRDGHEGAPMRLPAGAWGFVFDHVNPEIAGVGYTAGYRTDDGDRFALLDVFGCISKPHPHRRDTLAAYERVFREILESFRFC